MSESIHLNGSEDVARAGSTIQSAALGMQRAGGEIDEAVHQFGRNLEDLKIFMDDWLGRFEKILRELGKERHEQ
jgi:hypothetical protein